MKFLLLSAIASVGLFGAQTFAHDIHNVSSDHTHPSNYYTHSVSSDYDHHKAHNYNQYECPKHQHNYHIGCPTTKVTTNTATYYTRSYPVKNTFTYLTTPNTTIHQPPYAYSSCANRCDQTQKRITVSRNLGTNTVTYRAPSEYSAQQNYVVTPSNSYRSARYYNNTTTHVSPFKTHKLTTTTCYNCY